MDTKSLVNQSPSYERLAATLACIGDGIISTDLEEKVVYMNSSAEELTGWQINESQGKNIGEIIGIMDEEKNEPIESPISMAIDEGIAVGLKKHSFFISKQGMKKYISASCSPIKDFNAKVTGAVMVFRDITRIKQVESELERAKEAAEAANKAKSEFLANMSHEIRTPLNGMIGMINLTLHSDLQNDQKDNLEIAKSCADALLRVINDILDFSKMEAGKLSIENIGFNIKELVEDIIKVHTIHAEEKGLDLSYQFSGGLPQNMCGDPGRLKQVLNNLIGNGIKFTEKGSVSVSVKKYSRNENDIELLFSVSDTGIGIAEKEIGLLFKSFSQVDSSYTRKFGGTGLGLVISKQLIEMMGGMIWVESKKNKGSTFNFTIKLKVGNENVIKNEQTSLIHKENRLYKILYAEDDKVNQMVVERLVREKGHSITFANNGKEALSLVASNNFDVILMDIQMPEMDGIEATACIRRSEIGTGRHIPIIALTAYALKGDKEKFLSLGMDGYVSKPFDSEELFETISRLISVARNSSESILSALRGNLSENNSKLVVNNDVIILKLRYISEEINGLKAAFSAENIKVIEGIAHQIKDLSSEIEAVLIKNDAFKIELAARRGDILEISEIIKDLDKDFQDLYNKIIN